MKQAPRSWDWQKILEYGDFKKSDVVLETGAMFGEFSLELSPLVKTVMVTDSYDWTTRRFVKDGKHDLFKEWVASIDSKANLILDKANMEDLQYKDNSFDKVVCISAIEHAQNDRKCIEEMMRVLKPSGLLLLTTEYNPIKKDKVVDQDGSFYRIYDSEQLNDLIRNPLYYLVTLEVASKEFDGYTTVFVVLRKEI